MRRHQLLAAARLAFDQHREGRVGELRDLALQLGERRARADQVLRPRPAGTSSAARRAARSRQRRVGGLGDELEGAQRARVARVGGVVLAREHEDLHARRVREQVGDQAKALVRASAAWAAGRGRPARAAAARRAGAAGSIACGARVAGVDREFGAEHEGERVGDQRVVVDHQQRRACSFRRWSRALCASRTHLMKARFEVGPRRSARAARPASRGSAPGRGRAPRSPAQLLDVGEHMRGEEQRAALGAQAAQHRFHRDARRGVKAAHRLVEHVEIAPTAGSRRRGRASASCLSTGAHRPLERVALELELVEQRRAARAAS